MEEKEGERGGEDVEGGIGEVEEKVRWCGG